MKTEYKHIKFKAPNKKTDFDWAIVNKKSGDVLGVVSLYKRWKKHVAGFREGCVFDEGCLCDIADFLKRLDV